MFNGRGEIQGGSQSVSCSRGIFITIGTCDGRLRREARGLKRHAE